MATFKRLRNILRYGLGDGARRRKQRDKQKRRDERFLSDDLWHREDQIARRRYESYDAYVNHQASKLDKIVDRLHEKEAEDFGEFVRRFEGCSWLSEARTVLCLGARLGTEVKALHSLGYFAVGIDLNPGSENPGLRSHQSAQRSIGAVQSCPWRGGQDS